MVFIGIPAALTILGLLVARMFAVKDDLSIIIFGSLLVLTYFLGKKIGQDRVKNHFKNFKI